ncbi:ATP-binding cassette subfamily B protein [Paractinoplanes brasiliensis]|uniref:Fatty acid ABC transporter ATP-binding/permease protein n=2 Tax=Paractinoplanes brasiliensis TaxID=52695 RepID=A0A4V3C8C7_9ACTN|nr:ATP-binding cassette subfamily B protein [Actinoplanes brasiliensis]GID26178.1 multidrug ABC transporter ATP-binding protein [Actinoplanes brasiliensis]
MTAPRRPGPPVGGPPAVRMMAGPAPTEKLQDFKGSTKRLLARLKPQRMLVGFVVLAGAVSVALSVIGPYLLGHATDVIFKGVIGQMFGAGVTKADVVAGLRARGENTQADLLSALDFVPGRGIDFDQLARVLAWVAIVYVFAWLFGILQGRITAHVVQTAVYQLRQEVEAKLSRLPLSYFDQQPRGEVLSRATNDTDNIAQTLQQTFAQLITSLLMIVGVLGAMFWISPLLALIALITVPVSFFVTTAVGKRSQPNFVAQWSTTGKLNGHIEEMFTGHSLVKVFGRQDEAAEVFQEHNDKLYASSFRAQFISGLIQPAMMFISNLNYVLVAVVGGLRVASGSLSLGEVQAFIQYSRQFSQPLTQVASMANLIQSGVASAERVFALLDASEQSPEPAAVALDSVRGEIVFSDVSFRYVPDKPLISNLSLVVEPGQTVAIVGPTGAGKTTLVNLLMRFYDVDSGRILLDGVDIATMPREQLREEIGMVLQDTWLFGGTIAENIAYGADSFDMSAVERAATAAHVDAFVRMLPDGYDTVIDEEGSNVSAGQKQLITIARAFLAEPSILILDEATSSVDTRTEVLIQRAMATLREGRTSFVIAHRLSTIRDADVILVMENGQIVEQGTHDSLIAEGGAYARLYSAQFAQAVAEVD